MAIWAKGSGDGRTFEPAPEGTHQAVLVDVVDLGMLQTSWQGVTSTKHKVNLAWQIAEDRDDGKPFLVFKRYTLSLHEKSALRKDLDSWRGRTLSRTEEQTGVDLEEMIGKNCLLNITHKQVGDRTYANVASLSPLMKGMAAIWVCSYTRKIDRPTPTVAPPVAEEEFNGYDGPPPLTDDDIRF
jgi:hypothetical protein